MAHWKNTPVASLFLSILNSSENLTHALMKGGGIVAVGRVFVDQHGQAVRIPQELRLPDGVQQVSVRANGTELIIAPLGRSWDSFFLRGPFVSDDYLLERADQKQPERGGF
jgi:antitoxin VapB